MYCEVIDLITPLGYFTESELALLSSVASDTENETIKTDRVEAIIMKRSEYINTFLRGKYEVPITDAPTIKTLCVDLVSYDIAYQRYKKKTDAELIQKKDEALKLLNMILKGLIQVKETTTEIVTRIAYSTRKPEYDLKKY